MAKIDALLARLEKMGGESLLLTAKKPLQLVIGGNPTPLSAAALSDADIAGLLAEVLPADQRPAYEESGLAEFTHQARGGQHASVIAERSGKGLVVRFDLVPPEEPASEAGPDDDTEVGTGAGGSVEIDMSLPDADGEFELEGVRTAGVGIETVSPDELPESFETEPTTKVKAAAPPVARAAAPAAVVPPVARAAAPAPVAPPVARAAAPIPVAKPAAAPAPAPPPVAVASAPAPPTTTTALAALPPPGAAEAAKKLVSLLRGLLEAGGSDLHVSADSPPRMRVFGRLIPLKEPPTTAEVSSAMVAAILDEKQRARFAQELSVDFSFDLAGIGRFRANAVQQRRGCSLVFRAIPPEIPSMESIGLPPVVETLTRFPNGLILVTGPAGSGKTTTLASVLDHINGTWNDHIITVEDPVEFVYPERSCLVNQREVGTHVRTFAEALRSALREDPDVILVGELRDLETIQLAITAAETGHLVLGTLHTVDAGKTVERLIDVFPGSQKAQIRAMVSESIRGVISQQLVPAADGKGRVAAFEILVGDRSIANLIRESKTFQIPNTIRLGRARGMQAMDDSLADLVAKGKITAEVALAHTESPDSLKKALGIAPPAAAAAAPKRAPNAGR